MEDQVSGTIDHIVYANEENGFTVAKLSKPQRDQEGVCIVGNFPRLTPGETITCKGSWKHHPSFGRQFQVTSFELSIPKDIKGIQRYLESGHIKGIGKVNAKRIVDAFGKEALDIIDKDPMRLTEIEGIGRKKVNSIIEHWEDQKAMRDVLVFLRGHEVGAAMAKKIYKRYGDDSIEVIKKNPYALAREIFGIGFKTADKIAHELEIPHNSPLRIEAGIEFVLKELSEEGHVCYPEEAFLKIAEEMLSVDRPPLLAGVIALEKDNRVIRKELTTSDQPVLHIWLTPLYAAEMGIARELKRLLFTPCTIREIKCEKAVEWAEEKHHIKLATHQVTALVTSLEQKLHIITGGPGTGKSTITKAILSIHEKLSENILLCAPTGRAAKRMSEITRKKASTIHSLLEYNFTDGGFKRNLENPLKCDLIIIDEASMIDTFLMYALLKAIPGGSRVIFIGDIDQLPSVGAGNVLKDLIESRKIPITRLFQIFRQGKDSRIVINAHNINRGIFPELAPVQEKSDFHFIECEEPEQIAQEILTLVSEKVPASFSFDSFDEIQVLSPMRKGVIGIENLNVLLQEKLNPGQKTIERFGRRFRLHDKVMQIRNNYTKMVFNGDVGRITSIDEEGTQLEITYDGKVVEYDFNDLDEIVLAYAVSVHKYQGSECPCIIIPVHTSHFKLLQRNLLYTGITRGKKLVILVGTKKAVALALQNDEVKQRHTGLSYFIAA